MWPSLSRVHCPWRKQKALGTRDCRQGLVCNGWVWRRQWMITDWWPVVEWEQRRGEKRQYTGQRAVKITALSASGWLAPSVAMQCRYNLLRSRHLGNWVPSYTTVKTENSSFHWFWFLIMSLNTGMRCITAFWSTTDRIYDGGPIRLWYYNIIL
jgi:hypothetical protein